MLEEKSHSVIIIGAGLAGLTAADEILKANPKVEVTVLEAMDQPGGRTRSVQLNGAYFDLGAQWIGHPQKYTIELAKRAGSQNLQQFHKGNKFLQFGSNAQMYKTNIPMNVGVIPLLHMQMTIWKIDKLAKTVPLDNPRECQNALEWDSMTVHTWFQKNIWFDKIRRLFELSVRSIVGCDTNQVSFLFFLWYVHQNHGIDCLTNIQNGLQCTKFTKGTQQLSFYLEKEIKRKGGKINYLSFVNKVIQSEDGVEVLTRNGERYSSQYLIIAAPPPAIKHLSFEPQLSRQRRFICDRYQMGAYSKMIVLYDKHYWRQKGFSGEILSNCLDGPIMMCYDDTRPKQNGEVQPAIVIFFAASIDEQWTRNSEQCKKAVVEKLASFYKCSEMLSPIAVEMKVWNEEESIGGAPTAFAPPGVLSKIGNIREPQGRIHWAGTETATVSQGYMDGAIQSGIRVSKEIINRINGQYEPIKQSSPTSKWYSQIATIRRTGIMGKLFWWL